MAAGTALVAAGTALAVAATALIVAATALVAAATTAAAWQCYVISSLFYFSSPTSLVEYKYILISALKLTYYVSLYLPISLSIYIYVCTV